MAKTIHVTTNIRIPKVPNFLIRDDGSSFSIEDVKDDGLRKIGEAWTKELIEKAQKRRKAKESPNG